MQILSITCHNTSNNDTMFEKLANLLHDFPGPPNQTGCLTHILNLVVKSIIRQLDLLKFKKDRNKNETANESLSFAGNIEFEYEEPARRDNEGEEDNDDVEGWIDERFLMTEAELKELNDHIEPLCLLLTKVSY
jgi:hypothetical protein